MILCTYVCASEISSGVKSQDPGAMWREKMGKLEKDYRKLEEDNRQLKRQVESVFHLIQTFHADANSLSTSQTHHHQTHPHQNSNWLHPESEQSSETDLTHSDNSSNLSPNTISDDEDDSYTSSDQTVEADDDDYTSSRKPKLKPKPKHKPRESYLTTPRPHNVQIPLIHQKTKISAASQATNIDFRTRPFQGESSMYSSTMSLSGCSDRSTTESVGGKTLADQSNLSSMSSLCSSGEKIKTDTDGLPGATSTSTSTSTSTMVGLTTNRNIRDRSLSDAAKIKKTPKLLISPPTPALSLSKPATSLSTSATSLSTSATSLSTPTTSLLTPTTSLPTPATSLSTPTTSLPTPATSVTTPMTSLPTPATSVTTPTTSLPTPTTSLLTPAASLSTSVTSLSTPTTSLPTPTTSLPTPATSVTTLTTFLPTPATSVTTLTTSLPTPATSVTTQTTSLPTLATSVTTSATSPSNVAKRTPPPSKPGTRLGTVHPRKLRNFDAIMRERRAHTDSLAAENTEDYT